MSQNSISIIGGGLSGSALALLLGKYGYKNIHVFEKRPKDNDPTQRARSINLALSERGIKTLEATGHINEIKEIAIPMKGRMIHSVDGKQTFQPYSSDSEKHLYSISRQLLNDKLKTYAESLDNVSFHYDTICKSVDLRAKTFTAHNLKTNESTSHSFETMIGCDGAFSQVRQNMVKFDRLDYSQSYLEHGYKELSIPANEDGGFKLDKNSLHIWPRNSYMMIALPNIDGSFTCTLFFPFESEGGDSFNSLDSKEKVEEFFKRVFPDAYDMMPTLLEDYFQNPTSSLVTVKTAPWHYKSSSVLVGDAAHAIVPFYGQGMNAAFEDCLDFYNTITQAFPNPTSVKLSEQKELLEKSYKTYQEHRKKNSDAIAEMAVENFFEMRDLVADPLFVFKKKVEHLLESKFPGRYISRYELISFSTEPYANAQKIGLANQKILSTLVSDNPNFQLDKIDLTLADKLIKEYLNK